MWSSHSVPSRAESVQAVESAPLDFTLRRVPLTVPPVRSGDLQRKALPLSALPVLLERSIHEAALAQGTAPTTQAGAASSEDVTHMRLAAQMLPDVAAMMAQWFHALYRAVCVQPPIPHGLSRNV